MAPKISIITVAFNSDQTIARTIESVLNQSFQDFEYIIIDGGSTDKTNTIIEEYRSSFDGNLVHVSEADKGIYDAMNKGITLAKGKIIGLLNSDDYYLVDTLNIVQQAYLSSDLKSVITGELLFTSKGSEQILKTSEKRFIKKIRQYKNGLRHPATFVPKTIYDEVGLFNLDFKIASDAELMYRIYKNDYDFVFLNQTLSVMSDGGISNSKGITKQILHEKKMLLNTYCPNRLLRLFYMAETKLRFVVKEYATELLTKYRKIES